MLTKTITLHMTYTTESERSSEVHTCKSVEEAQYLIDLTRSLAPIEFAYRAFWTMQAGVPVVLE